jgi:hypothetical protein
MQEVESIQKALRSGLNGRPNMSGMQTTARLNARR